MKVIFLNVFNTAIYDECRQQAAAYKGPCWSHSLERRKPNLSSLTRFSQHVFNFFHNEEHDGHQKPQDVVIDAPKKRDENSPVKRS